MESLLTSSDRLFLEGGMPSMLLSDLEYLQVEDHGRPIVPYMDQVLAHDPEVYREVCSGPSSTWAGGLDQAAPRTGDRVLCEKEGWHDEDEH